MIVSVYGIPRSGKDTFIKQVLQKRNNAVHIKGSEKLNELSKSLFGLKFRELNNKQQKEIRIEFTRFVKGINKEDCLIVVDGHYAFPNGNEFSSVFTDEDLDLYDVFFYLKRTPEEIVRNFNSDNKRDYSEYLLDVDKVQQWMNFELSNMQKVVESKEKDFIVLDSEPLTIDFVANFSKTSLQISKEIAKEIVELAGNKNVILTDLDKTISINDLTNDFIEKGELDSHRPKTIFKGDYYSWYQFYEFHSWLCSIENYEEAVLYSLSKLLINEKLVRDIRALKSDSVVVALTTGMADAWNKKNKELNLFDCLYGYSKNNNLVITPLIKKLVAKYVTESIQTIGIGDSVIDLGMISQSNKGYLISMTKLDKRIIAKMEDGFDFKSIQQPSYSEYKYDFIKEGNIKW